MRHVGADLLAADHALVPDHIDDVRHLSARDIAHKYGYVRQYVARLCREGKVRGRQVGTDWYIDETSFKNYFEQREHERAARHDQLAAERHREYRDAQAAASHGKSPITPQTTIAPNTGSCTMDDDGVCFRLLRIRIQIRLDRSEPSN